MYLSADAVLTAIGTLRAEVHPFIGITFVACKRYGLSMGIIYLTPETGYGSYLPMALINRAAARRYDMTELTLTASEKFLLGEVCSMPDKKVGRGFLCATVRRAESWCSLCRARGRRVQRA